MMSLSMRAAVCGLFCGFLSAYAQQETPQELRRQIQSVQKETQREKDLHAQEVKRAQEFSASSKEKLRSLDEQARVVKAQADSLRAELDKLEAARRSADATARHFTAKKDKFRETVASAADTLAGVFAKDFPVRTEEHVAAAKELATGLRSGAVGGEDGLARLWDLLLERIRLGHTVESWSGYLQVEGASLSGKYLRYGAVSAAFVSQDGNSVLLLQKDGDGWMWSGVGKDLELRSRIKDALQVSEGRTAPHLVSLPFPGDKP